MLRQEDLTMLRQRGITEAQAEAQLNRFRTGFPQLEIKRAATIGDGITKLSTTDEDKAIARWRTYLADGGEVYKFVPASGAASRMFKALFEFAEGDTDTPSPGSDVDKLLASYDKLPFKSLLDDTLKRLYDKSLKQMLADGENRKIISAIISPEGMDYGQLPKAMLLFHTYSDGPRTAMDEQLAEGAQTTAGADGIVNLHFTVSAAHRTAFVKTLEKAVDLAQKRTGRRFHVTISEQKPSTDTIAANTDNTPFIQDGKLLLRPGGHGALIENLNDLDTAVVFIKNIDNVVPDSRRSVTVRYKEVIGGTLIIIHDAIARYIARIDSGEYTDADLREISSFMLNTLCVHATELTDLKGAELAAWLRAKLDRPLRVCGMVCNEGEPGGGPYLAVNPDGSYSPQVLESAQITGEYEKLMIDATHFNPVDLVCYIKDVNGKKYDLTRYVDENTGFISHKSSRGRELKAMELPGLWNGAMSDWNTVFVEVPIETFNPVKTVNDLLRPMHLSQDNA